MKKDKHKTEVIFYFEKGSKSQVFAFFPKEKYKNIGQDADKLFTCYAHVGQHSSCHIDYANECKQAGFDSYEDLKNELESLGYNLEVLNPPMLYKVYKIGKKHGMSGRRQLLGKNLSIEEARRLVNSYPDSSRSMVLFTRQTQK